VVPRPPIDEYVSDSMVGSDSEAPATSRRAPSKVAAPRCTLQTAGKISASQAATQIAEAKKRRGSGPGPRCRRTPPQRVLMSKLSTLNMTRVSHRRQQRLRRREGRRAETPCPALEAQGRSTSSTSLADDVGSNKRLKKAPPKPCKSNLRLATK
jgi:hypothetical protein